LIFDTTIEKKSIFSLISFFSTARPGGKSGPSRVGEENGRHFRPPRNGGRKFWRNQRGRGGGGGGCTINARNATIVNVSGGGGGMWGSIFGRGRGGRRGGRGNCDWHAGMMKKEDLFSTDESMGEEEEKKNEKKEEEKKEIEGEEVEK
jgi:hypothetical protein